MNRIAFLLFCLCLLFPLPAHAGFKREVIEGWPVYVDEAFDAQMPELAARTRVAFRDSLHQIILLLPERRVTELRRVPIYVTMPQGNAHGTKYASGIFSEEGSTLSGEAAGGVIIDDPSGFLEWLKNVPSGLLHELAHGYHGQVLSLDDPKIIAAYEHALSRGMYRHVARANGRIVARSYALTNRAEYFALLTQAYYWTSGFYPFTRDELKRYDPVGYETVRAAWEDRAGPQPFEEIPADSKCREVMPVSEGAPQAKAVIDVRNETDKTLALLWFDDKGNKVAYPGIKPHAFRQQMTRPGRKWEIDLDGACLAVVTVDGLGNQFVIAP